jgi:predicted DNA-binding protein
MKTNNIKVTDITARPAQAAGASKVINISKVADTSAELKKIKAKLKVLMERMEDLEDIYTAEKVMEQVRSGKMKTYTQEEIEKKHGIK